MSIFRLLILFTVLPLICPRYRFDADKCDPKVSLINAASAEKAALNYTRKLPLTFTSIVNSKCRFVSPVKYRWTIYRVNQLARSHARSNLLTSNNAFPLSSAIPVREKYLKIPRLYLPYGKYLVQVQVQIEGSDWVRRGTRLGWFRIVESALVPHLEGGSHRTVSSHVLLVLNASRSHDPDHDPSLQRLRFSWTCESLLLSTLCENLHDMSQSSGSILTIPSHSLIIDTAIVFTMALSSFDRGRTRRSVNQTIIITSMSKELLRIDCIKNCEPTVNPYQSLELKASCSNCEPNAIIKWIWSFETIAANLKQSINWVNETLYGREDHTLSIKPEVLEAGDSYHFKVKATNTAYGSEAIYKVEMSRIPLVGNCSVKPSTGVAIFTNFSVTCTDFATDNGPLEYTFYYNWNHTDIHVEKKISSMRDFRRGLILRQTMFPRAQNLTLAPGDPTNGFYAGIIIVATDSDRLYSQVILHVKVFSPESSAVSTLQTLVQSEISSDVVIKSLTLAGDTEGVLMYVISIGHFINPEFLEYGRPPLSTNEYKDLRQTLVATIANQSIYKLEIGMQVSSAIGAVIDGGEEELHISTLEMSVDKMKEVIEVVHFESLEPDRSFREILEATSVSLHCLSALLNASVDDDPLNIKSINMEEFYGEMEYDTYKEYSDVEWNRLEDNRRKSQVAVSCVSLLNFLSKVVLNRSRTDEGKRLLQTKCLRIWLEKTKSTRGGEHDMGCNLGSRIHIPDPRDLGLDGQDEVVNSMLLELKKNPYFAHWSSKEVNSNFLVVDVSDKNLNTVDFRTVKPDLEYLVERRGNYSNSVKGYINISQSETLKQSDLMIHRIAVTHKEENVLLVFGNLTKNISFVVTLKSGYPPTIEDMKRFHLVTNRNASEGLSRALFPEQHTRHGAGFYFLAILPLTTRIAKQLGIKAVDVEAEEFFDGDTSLKINYSLSTYMLKCLSWSDKHQQWVSHGCKLGERTRENLIHCKCVHLSAFSAGFLIAPNQIDLSAAVQLFRSVAYNPVVLATVATVWWIYLLLFIWAQRKDMKLKEKRVINILNENEFGDEHRYLVTIATGCRKGSGTSSTVFLRLFGNQSESGPRCLNRQGSIKMFQQGDEDMFLLTSASFLGELTKVRVWHKNDRGLSPDWYVSKIHVLNLSTKKFWVFPIGRWLSVKGRLSLDAEPESDDKNFLLEYHTRAMTSLRDGHLWFSIILPPTRSRFSCKQRLTCALCLLLMAMLTNIMFYGTDVHDPEDQLDLHSFRLSLSQVVIGLQSSLIVFPVGLLICSLFQNSRSRHRNRIKFRKLEDDSQDEEQKMEPTAADNNLERSRPLTEENNPQISVPISPVQRTRKDLNRTQVETEVRVKDNDASVESADENEVSETTEGVSCCLLPWWYVYVAWMLALSISILCSFFIILYGLTYGHERSIDWLVSMFTSFLQSVIVIEPVKVFLVAFVLTLSLKPGNWYGYLESFAGKKDFAELPPEFLGQKMKSLKVNDYKTLSNDVVEEYRYYHGKERRMIFIISEVAVFLVFLTTVLVVIYSEFPTNAYFSTQNIKALVLDGTYTNSIPFTKVRNLSDVIQYLNETLVPSLHATKWYNGADFEKIGYTADLSTKVVGVVRLRQKRDVTGVCPSSLGKRLMSTCQNHYSWSREDKKHYHVRWTSTPSDELPKIIGERSGIGKYNPWIYRTSLELQTTPLIGVFGYYSGGGYVTLLGRTKRWSTEAIKDLVNFEWLDRKTRVLIAEFTTYNANCNLFNIVQLIMEVLGDGSVKASYYINTVMIVHVQVGLDTAVGIARFLFFVLLLFLSVREILHLKRYRWRYFRDKWNWLELCLIFCSFFAVAVSVKRYSVVSSTLKDNDPSTGNKFVNFYPAAFWSSTLSFLHGVIISLATIKIWKLLSFNRYFALPFETLRASSAALCHFSIFVSVLLVAGAVFCRLAFGLWISEMSDTYSTLVAILHFWLGRVRFGAVVHLDSLFRGLFFVGFVFFVVVFLKAMFFSILSASLRVVVLREKNYEGPRADLILNYLIYQLKIALGKETVSWVEYMRTEAEKKN